MFSFCCFLFFFNFRMNCLVSNLVSPLLDGLNDGLDDGSLSNLSHWGKSIGSGFWESKTDRGSGNSDRGSVSNSDRGGSSNRGSSSISSWGNSVGSIWVRGSKASVSTAISKAVGIGYLRISHSGGRGNSASKNNKSVHGDECWLGSEELTPM